MKIQRTLGAVVTGAVLLTVAACSQDLTVTNPNNPDVARATATPADVQSLATSAVNSWYLSAAYRDPWIMLGVTADVNTMNYGNFGARFNNLEPRDPYNNNIASGDIEAAENPWQNQYGTLGQANDVLRAIAGGLVLPGGTDKYKALALWAQAGALSEIAMVFDQGFAVDETFDPNVTTPQMVPYSDMADYALTKLDALISLTASQNETYSKDEFPLVGGLTSAKLNRFANTMAAQLLAYLPRTAAEAANVDWNKVLQYADKGIGTGSAGAPFDFTVTLDGQSWYANMMDYMDYPSWMMVDLKLVHQMAPNVPDHYIGVPPGCASNDTACYDAYYAPQAPMDARMGIDLTDYSLTQDSAGTDFFYARQVQGDPNRGIYMQSPYYHGRYFSVSWQSPGPSNIGPAPYVLAAESDLIKAEALIRTGGDRTLAASLVNNTRVGRGGLTPLTSADDDATFLAAITYEREVETYATDGYAFFAMRHMDQLQTGTVRHLPVPASELQTDGIPVYTFGGAVQNPTGMNMVPNSAGTRFAADLAHYQAGPWRSLALPNGQITEISSPRAPAAPAGPPTKR